MNDTGVHDSSAILEHEAQGYSYEGGRLQKSANWDMSRAGGAGALYSTVEDLYRWNEALFSGRVLSEESLKAAFTPVTTKEDESGGETGAAKDEGYGYGWGIGRLRGLREISHGGGLHGFTSFLLRLPEKSFTAVVLANAVPPPPRLDTAAIAKEIAQLYLWREMESRSLPTTAKVAAEVLETYTGRYDYVFAILTVTREGDRLFAQLTGQPRFEIFPKSQTEFFWKVVDAQVEFVKDDEGKVVKAVHRQGGQTIQAARIPDVTVAKVDPKLYDAYTGKYDYGDGKAILTVTREGDRLFAQLTGQPRLEIFPKSQTEFFWKAVNAQVTFVKDQTGKVTKAIHEQAGRKFEAPRME
jgi:CubicO group peptidase (beta-lactamase class C family)